MNYKETKKVKEIYLSIQKKKRKVQHQKNEKFSEQIEVQNNIRTGAKLLTSSMFELDVIRKHVTKSSNKCKKS